MSFVNGIINDLREKRLWPVALALVVALIAVPVLLSSSTKGQPLAQLPQTGPAAPAGIAVPAVSVSSTPTVSRLQGRGRDPFTQQKLPSAPASTGIVTGSTAATTSTTAQSSTTQSSTIQSSTASQPTTTTTSTTPVVPKPTTRYYVYKADLAFGRAGHDLRTYRDVSRLTPLPSATDPLLVFLGLRNGGRTAVFVVSSLAEPAGDGKCHPSARTCDFLDLNVRQREVFLVVNAQGRPVEYQLKLRSIQRTTTPSSTEAELAHARVSTAGRRIVARAMKLTPTLRAISFSLDTGLLSYTPVVAPQLVHVGRQPSSWGDGVALGPAAGG